MFLFNASKCDRICNRNGRVSHILCRSFGRVYTILLMKNERNVLMKISSSENHCWTLSIHEDVYKLEGDLDPTTVDSCCQAITQLPVGCTLELQDLDIDDGPCLAVFITALRSIAPCTLVCPPRMLAHTIYKINARDIILLHPRSY